MYQSRRNEKSFQQAEQNHRTSRGYEINGQWYFELRGGGQNGPYESELKMQAGLNEFIKLNNQIYPQY